MVFSLSSKDKETREPSRNNPNQSSAYITTSSVEKISDPRIEQKKLLFFESALKQSPVTLEFEDEEFVMEMMSDKSNALLRKKCEEMENVNAQELVKKQLEWKKRSGLSKRGVEFQIQNQNEADKFSDAKATNKGKANSEAHRPSNLTEMLKNTSAQDVVFLI